MESPKVVDQCLNNLRQLVFASFHTAKKAHNLVFTENSRGVAAAMYLNKAIAEMSAAKALYYARVETLERYDVEEIFDSFDTFADEMSCNIATDHSHQWTDIEYTNFVDHYNDSVLCIRSE